LIGGTWLDSLAPIRIGSNCCISQGVYFCTGNHDWTDPAFGLIVKPIVIEDGAWVGARATVLPGVTVKTHAIIAAGSVISRDAEAYMIYVGNPAVAVKERKIREA
jgi:putative colanic acid biosynthesis acetyltransferase WcaF